MVEENDRTKPDPDVEFKKRDARGSSTRKRREDVFYFSSLQISHAGRCARLLAIHLPARRLPARRRVAVAAASTMPISCGLRPLVSKNLGQNGDATPKAAYNAA